MKIIQIVCTVEEGAIGRGITLLLESAVSQIYKAHFGFSHKLIFFWVTVPKGQAFQGGKPSSSSLIQIPLADGTPNSVRHPFMNDVCKRWQLITGCTPSDITLVTPSVSYTSMFRKSLADRSQQPEKIRTGLIRLLRFANGKLKDGFLNSSVNL